MRRAMHSRSECPICRAPLRAEDLFDAATEEEIAAQRLESEHTGNYGAKARVIMPFLVLYHLQLLCCSYPPPAGQLPGVCSTCLSIEQR